MAELDKKPNLYQKISEITASLGVIQKDSAAPAAMGGYRFISHGAMLGHLRHELTNRNVVIIPSGEEVIRADSIEKHVGEKVSYNFRTILKFLFTVVDGDNPSDKFVASWIGEGMDTSDKGVQKAGTSAEKYFLMKLFKVGDKDDPDALRGDSEGDEPARVSTRSMSATMEKPAEKAIEVPINQIPSNNGKSDDGDLIKARVEALKWYASQLPPSEGWFAGKVVPLVGMWDAKAKKGTLSDAEKEAGSAINYVFNQIEASHQKVCGEKCEHRTAAQIAVILGGRITDPAK